VEQTVDAAAPRQSASSRIACSCFVRAHASHGPADVACGVLRRNPTVLADLSARNALDRPAHTGLLAVDASR
jgi:hypothetical protein